MDFRQWMYASRFRSTMLNRQVENVFNRLTYAHEGAFKAKEMLYKIIFFYEYVYN